MTAKTVHDMEVLRAMRKHGDTFAQKLALRLREAFPDYFNEYDRLVREGGHR